MSEMMSYTRTLLAKLKKARVAMENAKVDAETISKELLPLLETLDPGKLGVVFEHDGAKSAGYRQQNKPSDVVDTAALIAYLKRTGKWAACSTTVLDMKKVEAEIAANNIRPRDMAKFVSEGKPATPYIKFMNPKRDSL